MSKFEFDLDSFLDNYDLDSPQLHDFEHCCGASILAYFPQISRKGFLKDVKTNWDEQYNEWLAGANEWTVSYYPVYTRKNNVTEKELEKRKFQKKPKRPSDKEFIEIFWTFLQGQIRFNGTFSNKHLYVAILIDCQKWIGNWLCKNYGFRLVSDRVVNPNHGNRLFMYVRDPLTPKGKRLKKKVF